MRVQSFTRSLAVVIGIDAYGSGVPRLTTAVNDATRLADLLATDHDYEAILLTEARIGGTVTGARLRSVFTEDLPAQLGPDDRLLVYFAGHGVALDGEDGPAGYLLPQDARPDDRSSFVPMTDLHAWLTALPCRHMLAILDCCFAGAFHWASTRSLRPLPQVLHKERYDRYLRSPAWQVITSASYDQRALDVLTGNITNSVGARGESRRGHSPFAQTLFAALQGAGDLIPAGGGDGVITASELALYLRETVEVAAAARANVEQTPQLWPLNKHRKGEFVFLVPGHPLDLPPAPSLTEQNNPYRGLKSYDQQHKELFFGREDEIVELLALADGEPFVAVLGASGTGKSSLVKAGVLARLPERYTVLPPMRPGDRPCRSLEGLLRGQFGGETAPAAGALAPDFALASPDSLAQVIGRWEEAHPGGRLVLTVDQFEELVTLCRDDAERAAFLALLAQAVRQHPDAFRLLIALRTDFEPQFAEAALFKAARFARYVVPPMDIEDLRQVIEGPASVRVLYFDPPELVDDLIKEVIQTPGALPLLSFTLSELYVKYVQSGRDDRALARADYEALGGVVGSLRNRATEEYEGLPDDGHRRSMERVMLRMVAAEGGELARRRVTLSELDYPTAEENARVGTVLDRLVEARLVVRGTAENPDGTKGAPYAEPAHDALVLAWDRLLRWKQAAEEYLPLQRRLAQAAMEWSAAQGEAKTGLLWDDDPRLPQVERLLAPAGQAKAGPLKRVQRTLWPAVSAPRDTAWLNRLEVAFTQASVQRRAAVLKRIVTITAAVMVVLAGLAIFAGRQANEATVQRNEANVQRNEASKQRDIALTREVEAVNEANLRSTEVAVRSTAQANEAAARQQAERESRVAQARALAARADAAPNSNPQLRLLLADEAVATTYRTDGDAVPEAYAALYRALAQPGFQAELPGHSGWIFSSGFSPDGRTILTTDTDGVTRQWASDGTFLSVVGANAPADVVSAFSPDGTRILAAGADGVIRFYALSGELESQFPTDSELWGASFSPDGNQILTVGFISEGSSRASIARIWDAQGALLATLRDPSSNIASAAFSPNGARVLTASEDGMARLWTNSGKQTGSFQSHGSWVTPASFSPDGSRVVVGGCGPRRVGVWDPFSCPQGENATLADKNGTVVGELTGHGGQLSAAVFSPDGKYVVTTASDGTARLWDAAGKPFAELREPQADVWGAAFRPDSAQIVTAARGAAHVWDLDGNQVATLGEGIDTAVSATYNPAGTRVLTMNHDMPGLPARGLCQRCGRQALGDDRHGLGGARHGMAYGVAGLSGESGWEPGASREQFEHEDTGLRREATCGPGRPAQPQGDGNALVQHRPRWDSQGVRYERRPDRHLLAWLAPTVLRYA